MSSLSTYRVAHSNTRCISSPKQALQSVQCTLCKNISSQQCHCPCPSPFQISIQMLLTTAPCGLLMKLLEAPGWSLGLSCSAELSVTTCHSLAQNASSTALSAAINNGVQSVHLLHVLQWFSYCL